MNYTPKEFEEEGNKIAEEYFNSDSEIGLSNYVEQHASEEYKKWLKEWKQEYEENWKKGISIG